MAKSKTQAFSRPPWERMMRFHNLIKEKSYPNCNKVAKEFEVSWRTIMRDVDFMKCRLKLPLEFDAQQNGYFYTKPVEQFPQMPFTEAEVFAMLVAHKAIATPQALIPNNFHNHGNYVISLGAVTRWLAQQAENQIGRASCRERV